MDPRSLLQEIDNDIECIRNCSWTASLEFPAYQCSPMEPLPPLNAYQMVDLFELTRPIHGIGGMGVARFDPSVYPVIPGGMQQNRNMWAKLSSDIISRSQKTGKSALISNGSHGKDRKALVCYRYKKYQENNRQQKGNGELRSYSINGDKRNARKVNGKSQKKQTSTSKPVIENNDVTCKAKLVIGIDLYSFFLVLGNGNNIHSGHPPLGADEMPTRARTVPEQAITAAKRMANRGARPGYIAGMLKDTFNLELTRRQVSRVTEMAKLANDLIGTENLEKYKHCMSDTDRVFEYLDSIGASYVALYHQTGDCDPEKPRGKKKQKTDGYDASPAGDKLIVESVDSGGNATVHQVKETGENEKNGDVMKYAVDTRDVIGAERDQTVLVALVWMTPKGKQYFQAFPEQMSVDGTHKTTKEEWELITFSIQDMNGGQETVMRCWAPNNRSWLYRWLFQTAVPALVGKAACEKTQLIICDGDPQECGQLDAAIKIVFINAVRRRCGWHIVDRGWNNHIGQNLGGRSHARRTEINNLVRTIKNWLYSMMKDIETPEEYKM